MRILLFSPSQTRTRLLKALATLAVDEGHDCWVFMRETKKKTHRGVSRIVGQGNVHYLHTIPLTMPEQGATILRAVDTERLRMALSITVPDVVISIQDKRRKNAPISKQDETTLAEALHAANANSDKNAPTLYTLSSGRFSGIVLKNHNNQKIGRTRFSTPLSFRLLFRETVFARKKHHANSSSILRRALDRHAEALKQALADITHAIRAKYAGHTLHRAAIDAKTLETTKTLSKTAGEIESVKDYDIIHEDTLWLKGWIDMSGGQIAEILVRVNEQEACRLKPSEVRGDKAEKYGSSKIHGFDAHIPLKPYGSRVKIQLFLIDKKGLEHRWKSFFVWLNNSVPDKYILPVLTGDVTLNEGGRLTGTLDTENYAIRGIRVLSLGETLAQQAFAPPKVFAKDPFALTLEYPAPAAAALHRAALHVWLEFDNGETTCWQTIESSPEAEAESPPDSSSGSSPRLRGSPHILPSIPDGQVLHNGCLPLPLFTLSGDSPYSSPVKAYINGQFIADIDPAQKREAALQIPFGNNRLLLELTGENASYAKRSLWNHIDDPEPCPPTRSCVSIAPAPRATVSLAASSAPPHIHCSEQQKILVLRRAAMPTDEIYILTPLQHLINTTGAPLAITTIDTDTTGLSAEERASLLTPDTTVVVCRYVPDDWIQSLTQYRNRIQRIVYLMDDDLCATPDGLWLPGGYRKRMMKVAQGEFQTMLNLCDHFMVACDFLARRYASPKTLNVEPAYLNPPATLDHLDSTKEITIAYYGTQVHRDDIAAISPALQEILEEHPHVHVQIVMGQYAPERLKDMPRVEVVPGMPWEDYKKFVAQARAHIALAPILRTPYNLGKSVIKILDIASLGAVGLYSRSEPYTKYIRDGENGFLVENDALMWKKSLTWLITHPQEIKRLAIETQKLAQTIGDIEHLCAHWTRLLALDDAKTRKEPQG